MSGGDRGGGVEQVGGVEVIFTTEARRDLESYLGPSFAVKAPLIQDDDLKRGEFCAARLTLAANEREEHE